MIWQLQPCMPRSPLQTLHNASAGAWRSEKVIPRPLPRPRLLKGPQYTRSMRSEACVCSQGAVASAAATSNDHGTAPPKVVGLGSCGLDYLAAVAAFPKPDEKLRTIALEVPARRPFPTCALE